MAILDACVESQYGVIIAIETDSSRDVNTPALRAKQILYRFRQEYSNPLYEAIQIRLSPNNPDNELWLIKNKLEEIPLNINIENLD